jgi:hypothetical protein
VKEEKIEVVAYAGYKSEERPMSLIIRGKRTEVINMWESSFEENIVSRTRKRSFVVSGSDGVLYRLYYYEDSGEWSLKGTVECKSG